MAKYSRKPKRPRDINSLATKIVLCVIEGEPITNDNGKNPNAVALGRKGGLKGGLARAKKLTAKERSEIAKKAAKARWNK
jgi:hypothetical protein